VSRLWKQTLRILGWSAPLHNSAETEELQTKQGKIHLAWSNAYFFRLAIVNILSNLMVPLASLTDIAFLGHLSEIRHLAGVALATVLFNYLYWTFGFLRMGTTGMTAQAVGHQNDDEVLLIGLRNGAIALSIGFVIVLLQVPLRLVGFIMLSADPAVEASGQAYYNALIWGAPATLLNYVLIGWYLGRAQSQKVLLLSAVVNFTNVGLNYLFIVRWGWASAGAGAATALSQGLMLGVGLGLASRQVTMAQLKRVGQHLLDLPALQITLALNGELMLRSFALISTFAAFTNISATLGTVILSSNAVLLQVVTLAAYFIDGFAYATESLVGILSVQGKRQSLKQLLRVAGISSVTVGVTFAFIFILFPRPLLQILTHHGEILDHVGNYTPWLLPVLGFGAIAYLLDGYFLGLTAGPLLRRATTLAALFGFAPLALIAWFVQSAHLLWLALAAFMGVRALTLGLQVPQTLRES
jgi:multidrug resistance protein, MATE family